MTLLDDIRADLVNESTSLSNTLRKAKILASIMGIQEFQDWTNSELSGYQDRSTLPNYRQFPGLNLGTFSGPRQSRAKNVILPTYNLPDAVKTFAENLMLAHGVSELEAMLADNSGDQYKLSWPQEYVLLARESIRMSNGMVLIAAHQPITRPLLSGILDNVKNKLLDFILELQVNNITLESFEEGDVDTDNIRNIFYVNVYGNNNVVASGENVHQKAKVVNRGDIESLLSYFRELGANEEDLDELKDAIQSEPALSKGNYGPRVRQWIGGMVSKVASSTWKVGLNLTSKVLVDGLNSYYGAPD